MKNLNRRLNVSKDALTTQGDVSGLAYLQGVDLPRMIGHGKVSLLIGADVLEALEPVEVRCSINGGPYAVKTKFGWTLNGPQDSSNRSVSQFLQLTFSISQKVCFHFQATKSCGFLHMNRFVVLFCYLMKK